MEKKIMRILNLFCSAGGASMGLHNAFPDSEIIGIDIEKQMSYPFTFINADALIFPLEGYDFLWASPPCQKYTKACKQWRKEGRNYPDLIEKTRERLIRTGKPYVIENVPGAPLINPIFLNGSIFNMRIHRPRYFECNFYVEQPNVPKMNPVKMGRPVINGDILQPVGHFSGVKYAQKETGISWMGQKDLAQAIPPAYSEYIALAYKNKRLYENRR